MTEAEWRAFVREIERQATSSLTSHRFVRNSLSLAEDKVEIQIATKESFKLHQVCGLETVEFDAERRQQEENPHDILNQNINRDGWFEFEQKAKLRRGWQRILLRHVNDSVAILRLNSISKRDEFCNENKSIYAHAAFLVQSPHDNWRQSSRFMNHSILTRQKLGKTSGLRSSRLKRKRRRTFNCSQWNTWSVLKVPRTLNSLWIIAVLIAHFKRWRLVYRYQYQAANTTDSFHLSVVEGWVTEATELRAREFPETSRTLFLEKRKRQIFKFL